MALTLFSYSRPIMFNGVAAPNILQRVRIPADLLKNSTLFHKYVVVDGDRPDTIALHYYGSSHYDWVVALSNNMVNMYEEWPLTQDDLNERVVEKFGSMETAYTQISHYRINQNLGKLDASGFEALPGWAKQYWSKKSTAESPTYSITPAKHKVTVETYNSMEDEHRVYWEPVTEYENMFELNERKRSIRLIDNRAVPELERTLKNLTNV